MISENKSLAPTPSNLVAKHEQRGVDSVFIFVVFLFLLSTLFDPADKVFGLKIPLYVACWGVGLAACFTSQQEIRIPFKLLIYTLLMIGIPATSIAYYYGSNGSEPFKGFELLKGYLFISFATLMYITRIDILKYLCIALTILAISVLVLTLIVLTYPELYMPAYLLGEELGIFSIDSGRDYGSDVVLFQMYFATSPMLAISIAYYFNLAKVSKNNQWFYAVITLLNICAMIVAGTRNNILAAVILPLALFVLYSRRKMRTAISVATVSVLVAFIGRNEIGALFDPVEASNSSKLILLSDYAFILSDPIKLVFGSGLGAFDQWTEKGYSYITELTYLEIIRNFGMVLGGVMILLLVYPIAYAFVLRRSYNEKNIILGYVAYLVMSMTNPLLFSSMGVMFLALIMTNISIYEANVGRHRSLMKLTHAKGGFTTVGVRNYELRAEVL